MASDRPDLEPAAPGPAAAAAAGPGATTATAAPGTDLRHGAPGLSVRLAVVWEVLSAALAEDDPAGRGLAVVDAGGGSGSFAVPLAQSGHRVTVVDASPDSLAALQRRAAERGLQDRVTGLQGDVADLPSLVPAGGADLVLCHNVLEMVDDPPAALAAAAGCLRPGGRLSLLVANRDAVVLARALAGHPDEALHALADPTGRWGPADGAVRRWDLPAVLALVQGAGLAVDQVHGVRTVADLVPSTVLDADPRAATALLALERALSDRPPFRELATQLHVLARR